MKHQHLTDIVLKSAISIHKELGPGLLESTYKECLYYELKTSGLIVEKEVPQPIIYKEIRLEHGYRLDIFIDRKVVVEFKSVEAIAPVHIAQALTYMKLTQSEVGLIINFNVAKLVDGIKRLIL